MKLFLTLTAFFALSFTAYSQNNTVDVSTYDFWVGKWDATWEGPDGSKGKGTNHLFKVLDEKVIEENFVITEGANAGFKGKSLSVFNPNTKQWHQAWADNQGGYFDFIGEVDGDRKIFKTKVIERGEKKIIQRMVFSDIKYESFTWDWENSQDGGETWALLWKINYTRQ